MVRGCCQVLVPKPGTDQALAPKTSVQDAAKLQHYDALRAAVITSVTGSVIAVASGLGFRYRPPM